MVKATKRSRKFNAKTAGGRGDVSTKKKGKVKQRGGKPPSVSSSKQQKQKQHDNDSNNDNDGGKKKARQQEELEKLKNERDAKDFTNLGTLDIESFFEKAVDGLEEEEGTTTTHDNNKNDDIDEESDDDDDEGSIDSYASILGSSSSDENDEDIEASEKQLRDQLAKLGEDDPEFHKYLKEVRVTRYTMRALVY